MSYVLPRLDWDRMRDGTAPDGRPALEVPAELSALAPAALALLPVRLAWHCAVAEIVVRLEPDAAVVLVGKRAADVTARVRADGDRALGSVAADAAAGWTARDEAERHGPFAWR